MFDTCDSKVPSDGTGWNRTSDTRFRKPLGQLSRVALATIQLRKAPAPTRRDVISRCGLPTFVIANPVVNPWSTRGPAERLRWPTLLRGKTQPRLPVSRHTPDPPTPPDVGSWLLARPPTARRPAASELTFQRSGTAKPLSDCFSAVVGPTSLWTASRRVEQTADP